MLKQQNTKLCDKVKFLEDQLKELSETVQQLSEGRFDITLEGGSQEDMSHLLQECNACPQLATEMKLQDTTGTLDLFWKEQLERASNPSKRKQWNPIVLRCVIVYWCVICDLLCHCSVSCVQIHATPMGEHG